VGLWHYCRHGPRVNEMPQIASPQAAIKRCCGNCASKKQARRRLCL
jgi:hypothetical protein